MKALSSILSPLALLAAVGCMGGEETSNGNLEATLEDFCDKCSGCVGDLDFDEGFCLDFVTGTSFDHAACSTHGDRTQLDTPVVTLSTLDAWSCAEYDDAQ